jgi:hypothetical protein
MPTDDEDPVPRQHARAKKIVQLAQMGRTAEDIQSVLGVDLKTVWVELGAWLQSVFPLTPEQVEAKNGSEAMARARPVKATDAPEPPYKRLRTDGAKCECGALLYTDGSCERVPSLHDSHYHRVHTEESALIQPRSPEVVTERELQLGRAIRKARKVLKRAL